MRPKLRRSIASVLIVSVASCAGPQELTRDDRLSLSSQSRIHAVLHSPEVPFTVTTVRPDGMRFPREEQLEDPAVRVKTRLVRAFQATLSLTNVSTVSDVPHDDNVKTLKNLFKTGLVLDVRTMEWGVENDRASYTARARMIRVEDSTLLWEANCSVRWIAPSWWRGTKVREVIEAASWWRDTMREVVDDCAAQLSAKAFGIDRKPVQVTGYVIPAEGLPVTSRIVASEQPIELAAFEMTAEERVQFEERRSARIDSSANVSLKPGGNPAGILLCVILLPVCILVGVVTVGVVYGIQKTAASAREPTLIPEQEGSRLAAMLKEQATGGSLASRMLRFPESAPVPAAKEAGSPRLVVRMKTARPDYSGTHTRVAIVAQAQAFLSTGAEWEPTEHRYEFPSLAWTANNDELVRREVDKSLDALAESISWAYLSKLPTGISADKMPTASAAAKDDRQAPGNRQ